jgi:hypothetical protein
MMPRNYSGMLLLVVAATALVAVAKAELDPSWQDTEMTTR